MSKVKILFEHDNTPDGSLGIGSVWAELRIYFNDLNDVYPTRVYLKKLGCVSELSDLPLLISLDIPPKVSYTKIERYLEKGIENSKLDYEEACIVHIN